MAKRIVVCSDGTWNKWESGSEKNTNVGRFKEAVNDADQSQIMFYDSGVGTGVYKYIGGLTGMGISENIIQCYRYIAENYVPGDQIYLFGFSRGAYTVRIVAGLIYKCGLLKSNHIDQVKNAYELYHGKDEQAKAEFKKRYTHPVCKVEMLGVWDTVGAFGIPVGWLNKFNPFFKKFKDRKLNPDVKNAYHAVSIDEKRKKFAPTMWEPSENIEQVWFSGEHSDVGGGNKERGLSNIALYWMLLKAKTHGLTFHPDKTNEIKPCYTSPLGSAWSGFWKFFRKYHRPVSASASTLIHLTAEQRLKEQDLQPKYQPVNLLEWDLSNPTICTLVGEPAPKEDHSKSNIV